MIQVSTSNPPWRPRPRHHHGPLALVATALLPAIGLAQNSPFSATTIQHLSQSVVRPNQLYDLQPSVMYDRSEPDPSRRFKMWWLGRYDVADADLPPSDLHVGDRIYYATSADGSDWSNRRVVLKGRGGLAGADMADDHLVGSPSVLKVHGVYYMFYEGYGTQVTKITNLWHAGRQDTWNTHGTPQHTQAWDPGYAATTEVGLAPRHVKRGTHPIYSGEVVYPGGKINRFLSARPIQAQGPGTWRDINDGKPAFWLYNVPAPGRKAIYVAFNLATSDSFATDRADLGGHAPDGVHGWTPPSPLLGYGISAADSADMARANQNAICLCRSADGVNWTRVHGAAGGGALRVASRPFTNLQTHGCPDPETFDLHRAYGAGFPVAFVRDGMLELSYADDTQVPISQCIRPAYGWRFQIQLERIDDVSAYASATPQYLQGAGVPCDAKWSAMLRRYMGLGFSVDGACGQRVQDPILYWSDLDAPFTSLPWFPPNNKLVLGRPINGRLAGCGGLLGDELGQTVDFAVSPAYSAFHIYFESYPGGVCPTPFESDIGHVLVFGYPADMRQTGATFGMVAVPDTATGLQTLHFRHVLGPPGAPMMLVLRSVNGVPTLLPLVGGLLDTAGRATLTIPIGATGLADLQLEAFSLTPAQQVLHSGPRILYLR